MWQQTDTEVVWSRRQNCAQGSTIHNFLSPVLQACAPSF